MDLVLDISTSAEFWRRIYPVNRSPEHPSGTVPNAPVCTAAEIARLAPSWITDEFLEVLGGRIHVMAFDVAARRDSGSHVVHVWSMRIPEGSFFALGDNVFIAAPTFMFLVAASTLSLTQLIAFGCELCGLYSFDKREKRGFRKRKIPLTSIEQLQQFLQDAKDCRGCQKALAALPYVLENSASPMETFDAMALCLAPRLGGYGLRKPLLNVEVPLNSRAARIAKRRVCYPDMCYLDIHLDIEHHGKLDHSEPEDQASDRARVNALKEMGFDVIELTKDQVGDIQAFEYIVQRIARLLGKRLRKQILGATPSRLSFRKDVTAWNRLSGRLR